MLRTSNSEHELFTFEMDHGLGKVSIGDPSILFRKSACQNGMRMLDSDRERAGDRDGELGKR